uniref:Uncharacterized protein n=1 Tax=Musa acuminata subsp. malaccensis TaxID=214687 RepID=A0A804HN11_MUSAM
MASPPSSSPSPPPLSGAAGDEVALASSRSSSEERATKALESLMWPHDLDSTMSESSLGLLRDRYSVPAEFTLIAPEPGQRAWSFGLRWAARAVDNTAPALDEGELRALRRLKEILPSSRVIRKITEAWLVEAGLSPVPREMVNLAVVHGGRLSSAVSPRRQVGPSIGTREAPVDLEDPAGGGLTRGTRVWADGETAAAFVRGGLHPDLAREMYTLSSDVLLGKSVKSLLWGQHYAMALADRVRDAGRALGILCERNAELRKQLEEVRAGVASEAVAAAEQRSSELEAEATRLRAEAGAAGERVSSLEAEVLRLRSEAKASEEEKSDLRGRLEGA